MNQQITLKVIAYRCLVVQNTVQFGEFIFESKLLSDYNSVEVNVVPSTHCNQVAVFDGPNFICSAQKQGVPYQNQWAGINTEQLIKRADYIQMNIGVIGNIGRRNPRQLLVDDMKAEVNRRQD